jgi:hypothetical protein
MPRHDHDDDDKRDRPRGGTTTTTSDPTTSSLVTISRQIMQLSEQLDTVLRNYVDPPNPDRPVAVEATNTIIAQAAHMGQVANEILIKLGN